MSSATERTYSVELTDEDLLLIGGALSAQLRYAQRGSEKAKQDDAINRWADFSVRLGRVMDKLPKGVLTMPRKDH